MAPPRCATIRDLLSAYIDGELSPRDQLMVQSHLAECASCAKEAETLKATAALIHDLPKAKLPEDFHASLVRRVRNEPAPSRATTSAAGAAGSRGGFWRRSPLRSILIGAAAFVMVFWAGGVAYFMGLPIPGAALLGLHSKSASNDMGFVSGSPPGTGNGAVTGGLGAPSTGGTGAVSKGVGDSAQGDRSGGLGAGSGGGADTGSLGSGSVDTLAALGAEAGRQVILNVNLTLECAEVAKARDQAIAAAQSAGGFVEALNYWTDGQGQTAANLTLRVPSASVTAVLEQLRPLGHVLNEQAARVDVTAQHIDLTARLDNLRLQEQQLLTLLGKAENLGDIFAIQNELSRVRTEIETYEAQLRALDEQVSLSTVYLYLQPTGAGPAPGSTFWERLVDAFVNSLKWLGRLAEQLVIFVATVTVPLLILAGVVWVVYRAIRNRRRRVGV